MASVEELTLDLGELDRLLASTNRPRVKAAIAALITSTQTALKSAKPKLAVPQDGNKPKTNITATKLSTYAWDQSDKFVKIYITLKNSQSANDDDVTFTKSASAVDIIVRNVDGKTHQFTVNGLLKEIDPEASYFKLKTDMVLVMLRKTGTDKWGALTKVEQKQKDDKDARMKPADSSDPQASMMNMMKNMYDEGDDDMKRQIKKTWFESQQNKQNGGGAGGIGGMPGMGAGGMPGMPDFGGM